MDITKRTGIQNKIWQQKAIDCVRKYPGHMFMTEQLHDWHKRKFLGFEESEAYPGLYKPKSTADLDTVGFAEFREAYCKFLAEQGLWVPDPDPDKKKHN